MAQAIDSLKATLADSETFRERFAAGDMYEYRLPGGEWRKKMPLVVIQKDGFTARPAGENGGVFCGVRLPECFPMTNGTTWGRPSTRSRRFPTIWNTFAAKSWNWPTRRRRRTWRLHGRPSRSRIGPTPGEATKAGGVYTV